MHRAYVLSERFSYGAERIPLCVRGVTTSSAVGIGDWDRGCEDGGIGNGMCVIGMVVV